jgi:glycosyltransferase involved in cell wall biosynthesis
MRKESDSLGEICALRVVIVSRDFVYPMGGFEEYIHQLSSRLRRNGLDVAILTTTRNSPRAIYHEAECDGVQVRRYPVTWSLSGYCYSRPLRDATRAAEYDVLHAQGWGNYAIDLAARESKRRSRPLVVTPHAFFQEPGRARILKAIYSRTFSRTVMKRAYFIALTETQARELRSKGATRTTTIPEGVDTAEFERQYPRPSYFPDHRKVVLCVGRLAQYKGLEHVLMAVKRIEAGLPDLFLMIVGENWGARQGLEKLSRDLGLKEKVTFTGQIPRTELLGIYQASDLCVNASQYEGFGISLVEAMACAKPVISTPTGVAADLTHLIPTFSYGDVTLLAANILRILKDEKEARDLGLALRRLVEERYSWDRNLIRIMDLYRKVSSPT